MAAKWLDLPKRTQNATLQELLKNGPRKFKERPQGAGLDYKFPCSQSHWTSIESPWKSHLTTHRSHKIHHRRAGARQHRTPQPQCPCLNESEPSPIHSGASMDWTCSSTSHSCLISGHSWAEDLIVSRWSMLLTSPVSPVGAVADRRTPLDSTPVVWQSLTLVQHQFLSRWSQSEMINA